MPWRISFEVWGEKFRPGRVSFSFTESQDPGTIGLTGIHRGKPLPYGSASYVVPSTVSKVDSVKYLLSKIAPILDSMRAAGATDWHVNIARYYHAQCNEEYSLDELRLIAQLDCGFTYSAYSMSEEEERKMQQNFEENGFVV
jgi:hypothetical protein